MDREPICDRLRIIARVCLKVLQFYILWCLYAPSYGTEDEGRTMMATANAVSKVPQHDMLLITRDLNAKLEMITLGNRMQKQQRRTIC